MNYLLGFTLLAALLLTTSARCAPPNAREGYPLPGPWVVGSLPGPGRIGALEISADGKFLYALTWENGTRGWNLATKESVPVPAEEEAKLTPIRNHSNDGSPRPRPTTWEPVYESEPTTYDPHVVSADGHTSYQAMDDGSVQIVDLTKRPPPRRWNIGEYNRSFAIDADTGNLATGRHLLAWDVKTGAVLGDQPKYDYSYVSTPDCVFWEDHVPYGLIVMRATRAPVSASQPYGGPPQGIDQLGKLNLKTGEIPAKMPMPRTLFISRSGHYLLAANLTPSMTIKPSSAGKDPALLGYGDYESAPSLQLFDDNFHPLGSGFVMDPDSGTTLASVSPGDKYVAALGSEADSGAEKGPIRIYDLATQKPMLPAPVPVLGVVSVAVDDNGHFFAATKYGGVVEYQAPSGEKVGEIAKAHHRPIETMAVSPDNRVLATQGDDDMIKLWSIPDLKPLGFVESANSGQETWREGLGFYDSGTILNMTNVSVHELQLLPMNEAMDEANWNVDSSTSPSACLAISSDSKQIAIGEEVGVFTVIENASGKRIAHVAAHPGGIKAVEFVAGSYKINTFGADGKCLLWDFSVSTNPIAESDAKPTPFSLSVMTGSGLKKLFPGDNVINVTPAPGIYRQSELSPHYRTGFNQACLLPGEKILALTTWTNLYLYDLQTERVIWGYSSPSRPVGLVYDALHHDLITSHQDGITRRWAIPDSIVKMFP